MGEENCLYDAFISYRHLPLDKAVGVRLQELLESYRPPKGLKDIRRIRRVFRDQSELPTSGDLSADIHNALLDSRYLIVVCSSKTKESKWCMEEIRQFREAHGGRTNRILLLLAEGEPKDVFPEQVLTERYQIKQEDGSVVWEEHAVEPLCGDIRADSVRQSLKLLKTEFLRIAAPVMGCGFDDLYQRHLRRKRKKAAYMATIGFAVLSCILGIVSAFAYRTYMSEKRYRLNLAESYTQQGARQAEEGNLQEALLYYASALELEPVTQTAARTGAALLLEQNVWPCFGEEKPGTIMNGTALSDAPRYIEAYSSSGGGFLAFRKEGYVMFREDGTEKLLPDMGTFIAASPKGDTWVFCSGEEIFFYDTADGEAVSLPAPTKVSDFCEETDAYASVWETMPAAMPVSEERAIVVYGGYVYLYEKNGTGMAEKVRIDLADVFPEEARDKHLEIAGHLWISRDGTLAVVESGFGIAAFDTENLHIKASHCLYLFLNDVAISNDASRYALVCTGLMDNPAGSVKVYDKSSGLLLDTPADPDTILEGAVFDPDDPDRLLAWGRYSLHFWNIRTQSEFAVPLQFAFPISNAAFTSDGRVVVSDREGRLHYYGLVAFKEQPSEEAAVDAPREPEEGTEVELADYAQAYELENGLRVAHSYSKVYLLDENGEVLDETGLEMPVNEMVFLPGINAFYLFYENDCRLYYMEQPGDSRSLGDIRELDMRGHDIDAVYPLENGVIAATGTNQLMLFLPEDETYRKSIQLKNYGAIRSIRELGEGCVAAEVKVIFSQTSESYHFTSSDVVELWDINAGVHIADIASESTFPERFPVPGADEKTVAFLKSLVCCMLDESQNVIIKTPSMENVSLGSWESRLKPLGFPEKQEPDTASGPEESFMEKMIRQYENGPESGKEEEWFASMDEVWEKLSGKEYGCTDLELNRFYKLYQRNAIRYDYVDQMETGLRVYIQLTIGEGEGEEGEGEEGEEEEIWITEFDTLLVELMTYTDLYDEMIADMFFTIANVSEEELDSASELDYDVNCYQISWLRYYGLLLTEDAEMAFAEFDKLQEKYGVEIFLSVQFDILEELYREDPEAASALANDYLKELRRYDDDGEMAVDVMEEILKEIYVLVKREIISEEYYDRYLRELSCDCGLIVGELSPEAVQMGLMQDDFIFEVEDHPVGCMANAEALFDLEDRTSLKLFRDGRIIELARQENAGFAARFSIRLTEEQE